MVDRFLSLPGACISLFRVNAESFYVCEKHILFPPLFLSKISLMVICMINKIDKNQLIKSCINTKNMLI